MITSAAVQEILNRADIVDVAGQFVRLKKRGSSYIANCPFHNEKTPSFNVSPAKKIYKCFGCGKAGNVVTIIQEHEKLSYPKAMRWLADYYKITIEDTERSPEQQHKQLAEEGLRILNEFAATRVISRLYPTMRMMLCNSYLASPTAFFPVFFANCHFTPILSISE